MMTLPILIELAQQGDATAIAVLMNAALKSEKIRVKVILDGASLLVLLRSLQPLNQHSTIAFIRRGLLHLQPESIQFVRAYAWHLGQDLPTWIAEFPVAAALLVPVTAPLNQNQSQQLASEAASSAPPIHAAAIRSIESTPAAQSSKPGIPKPHRFRLGFFVVLAAVVYFVMTIG